MSDSDNKICPTHLLSDDPSDIDELGGSHERVAHAIANLILSEDGGKSIGLEGEWGTGKSTIIKLLNKYLKENNNDQKEYLLFTFDAWAHKGDPLRRTFLEQLLKKFTDNKWISESRWKDHWESKWEELVGLKTSTKTTNQPRTTKLGTWVIFFGFFVPFGLALVNSGLRDGVTLGACIDCQPAWQFLLGSIFSFSPLLVFLFVSLMRLCKRKNKSFDLNWGLLVQKFESETTTFTTKSIDPTSVEFEKFFIELINDALGEQNHHLVITVDNLDRIAKEEALSMLSTLQTFLQCETRLEHEVLNKLWILIPYDRNYFEKLIFTNHDKELGRVISDEASSLIDKRFQICFRVPPITLSNWQEYFKSKFLFAFPTDSLSEKEQSLEEYKTLNIYTQSILTIPSSKSFIAPTPREIKLFINQMGAIHRQWNRSDEDIHFPLHHIAYFVHLRLNEKVNHDFSIFYTLLTKDILDNKYSVK